MSKTIIAVRHFGLGGHESLETANGTSLEFWSFTCLKTMNILYKFKKNWRGMVLPPGWIDMELLFIYNESEWCNCFIIHILLQHIILHNSDIYLNTTVSKHATKMNISFRVVSEDYFVSKRHNNPENLRNRCDFCKRPQPRYKSHPNKHVILPKYK